MSDTPRCDALRVKLEYKAGVDYCNCATCQVFDLAETLEREASARVERVQEAGPWKVVEHSGPYDWAIASDDFHHDVVLVVTGDFDGNAGKRSYAEEIARRLNAASASNERVQDDESCLSAAPYPVHLQGCQHDKAWLALKKALGGVGAPTLMELVERAIERMAESVPVVPRSGRAYTVEVEKESCDHCGVGRMWTVVGPDEIAVGISWGEEEGAEEHADALNCAYAAGQASRAPKMREIDRSALNWPTGSFRVHKDRPNNEHAPWFVVCPDGWSIPFNAQADDAMDKARAEFVAAACNAAIGATNDCRSVDHAQGVCVKCAQGEYEQCLYQSPAPKEPVLAPNAACPNCHMLHFGGKPGSVCEAPLPGGFQCGGILVASASEGRVL